VSESLCGGKEGEMEERASWEGKGRLQLEKVTTFRNIKTLPLSKLQRAIKVSFSYD